MTVSRTLALALTPVLLTTLMADTAEGQRRQGRTPEQAIAAATEYLKAAQAEDGTWSKEANPGVTGIVLAGLLKSGAVAPDDLTAAKALAFIEGLADEETGHLAAAEGRVFHLNYITSVNVIALKASGLPKYDTLIARGTEYVKNGQVGSDGGTGADDRNYGGFGYRPGTRADMSNTHFALDGLKAGGTPQDDPVYERALVFVSRSQNLESEFNDQPWAGAINDGSFFYVMPQPDGQADPAEPRPGHGSMTAAGLKSFLFCGLSKDDPRVKKATEWIAANYSVDVNPGRQEGSGGQGYYYYLLVLAKCLDALGEDEFVDADGNQHDWRAEITRALLNRQKPDGRWVNDFSTWMEGDPNLCTGYALQTLAICAATGD